MGLPPQVAPPDITVTDAAPTAVPDIDVIALPVLADAAGPVLGPGSAEVVDLLGEDLLGLLEAVTATGKVGEVIERVVFRRGGSIANAADGGEQPGEQSAAAEPAGEADAGPLLVLLVGVGSGSPDDLRRAGAALARHAKGRRAVATSLGAVADDAGLRALVEGLVLGSFGFHWRSDGPPVQPVGRVVLALLTQPDEHAAVVARAVAVAGASWRARTLALVPSNLKSPAWMVERATEVAEQTGLSVRVWDETQLVAEGFGGIAGVGQGSATPPRLVQLGYRPAKGARSAPHVVLVGKGITFDSGGLSIKPREAMSTMKRDMTGAGVVLSVMAALAAVDCPVRVTGLLPLAENAVGARSMRPGDVLRHYGGRTSEVTNTDAEGRLVLGDALAYAVAELKPDAMVDVATLTGAIKLALGQRTGGCFSNDDALAAGLRTASLAAGEPLWRMPLVADYEDRISSKVGDADNAGGPPGAITAALFLQHFVGDVPWAHLDIASVGDSPVDEFEYTKGATGFGARVLLHWLEQREPLAGVGRPTH